MIKEGSFLYTEDGRTPVVPYTGKYAVRSADVFAQLRRHWAAAGLDEGVEARGVLEDPWAPGSDGTRDGPAVHGRGDRGANCAKISARSRGDQYRVELTLSPCNVLRQHKWGKDIVSAVEICDLLALEHVRDRDPARAELEPRRVRPALRN